MIAPPLPKDPAELQRVEHTRLRRRVVYSMHEDDVMGRLKQTVGNVRKEAWPPADMTANPARHVYQQLSGLYRQVPEVKPPDGAEDVAAAISEAGWWQLAQRNQRDTLALNDHLVHVDIVEDEPVYRLVPPDMVSVEVNPARPSEIVAVREWAKDPDKPDEWVQYVTDPRTSTYAALDSRGDDVSARVLKGEFSGDAYRWQVDGKPALPYIAYHAAETGYAFDPFSAREVFDGSLQLGVYYTLLAHVMADASWAQRYAIGAEVAGLSISDDAPRAEVITDPAMLLMLRADPDHPGQPVVGQWTAPLAPTELLSAIERYERRVVEMALGTVGVSRRESDVRSAASLAVSREAQREAQRSYEPLFRRSDLALCRLTSGLMGAPTSGWRISYKSLPRDAHELAAETERLIAQVEAGLLDRVTAYQQLHPGLTRDEASAAVSQISSINRATAPA